MITHLYQDNGDGECTQCGMSRMYKTHDMPLSANAIQIGGSHYKNDEIQIWDFIIVNGIPYMEGNIIKYVARWRAKGGIEDLKKARHYMDKLIEVETENEKGKS